MTNFLTILGFFLLNQPYVFLRWIVRKVRKLPRDIKLPPNWGKTG